MTYGLKEAHDELLSELEDLREKYEEVCETSAMLRADMTAARERQAKLRELVRDMYAVMIEDAANCDVTYPEQFEDRMRELGIEVDA